MAMAMKQRMAPIHSRIWNPPSKFLRKRTHSGVVFGGVSALGPSLSKFAFACAEVNPCIKVNMDPNRKMCLEKKRTHLLWVGLVASVNIFDGDAVVVDLELPLQFAHILCSLAAFGMLTSR